MFDEAKEVFISDQYEKSKIAQSAHNKTRNSKRYLASNNQLTQKEWKNMNGEVESVNLNVPIVWGDFLKLGYSLQAAYINGIADKYHADIDTFSKIFKVRPAIIRRHIKQKKLNVYIPEYVIRNEKQTNALSKFFESSEESLGSENISASTGTSEPKGVMTWNELKSKDNQFISAYLIGLSSSYGLYGKDLASLFGVTSSAFCRFCQKRNIDVDFKRLAKTANKTKITNDKSQSINGLSITFTGDLNLHNIFATLEEIIGNAPTGDISITFSRKV